MTLAGTEEIGEMTGEQAKREIMPTHLDKYILSAFLRSKVFIRSMPELSRRLHEAFKMKKSGNDERDAIKAAG
jgi:hypothetical protein